MNLRHVAPFLLVAAMALTGCDTIDSRIHQKSAVFASLPAADQDRLRKGTVAIGDSPDMVFIAIGAPSRRIEKQSAQGNRTVWIYRRYYETYDGDAFAGYRRQVFIDRRTGRRFVSLEPCYAEVYHDEAQETLRIVFDNGQVSAIEELKR